MTARTKAVVGRRDHGPFPASHVGPMTLESWSMNLTWRWFDFHTEEPMKQHPALRDDDCLSAQSEDDCNDRRVPVGVQWLTI